MYQIYNGKKSVQQRSRAITSFPPHTDYVPVFATAARRNRDLGPAQGMGSLRQNILFPGAARFSNLTINVRRCNSVQDLKDRKFLKNPGKKHLELRRSTCLGRLLVYSKGASEELSFQQMKGLKTGCLYMLQ